MSQKIKTSVEIDGSLTASQIANATTDTDKFLVSDGGTVKYRTGAELASDLGIASGSTSKVQHQVKAGVAINKGQAVYVTSADGTNMIVGLASNASEATSSKTMGLLNATVVANGFADVVTEGLLDGLDTSTATVGNPVWLGTGGNLIYGLANKPYAPNHLVFIGIVTRVNANNGEIFVKVQNGFELDEIHDVDLKTTTKVNGHLLGYNGSLWVNKTIAEWLGYTPYNASNPAGYISSYTETDTLASVTSRGATTTSNISTGTISTLLGGGINLRNSANTANVGGFSRRGSWEGNSNYDPAIWAETGYGLYFYTDGSATTKMSLSTVGNLTVSGTTTGSRFNNIVIGSGTYKNTISLNGDSNLNISTPSGAVFFDTYAEANGSLRAPIFYDSNDTSFYTDPASTSNLNKLRITSAGNSAGGNILMGPAGEGVGKWSYLTGTHYNATSQSKGVSIIGLYASASENAISIGGNIYEANPATEIRFYTHNAITHGTGGSVRMVINSAGNVEANVDMRAPIFYDYNNTAYYVDPSSGSYCNNFTANQFYALGWFRNTTANTGLYNEVNGNHIYSRQGKRWGITGNDAAGSVWLDFYGNHEATYRGSVHADTSNNIGFLANDGGWGIRTVANKNVYVHGNTLYVNADNQSSSNIIMQDSDHGDRQIHCNSNRIGFLNQSGGWGSWCEDNGNWISDTSVQSPIFYDYDNTGYYLNPASLSNVNSIAAGNYIFANAYLETNGPVYGTIFYDNNNRSYYCDPSATSNFIGLTVANTINGNISGNANTSNTDYLMSDRDFPSGTLIQTSINYNNSEGDPFVLEIKGNSYGNGMPMDVQIQGYIYANTIINTGGYSNGFNVSGIRAIRYNGNLCFWFPTQGYWNGYTVKAYTAYGGRQVNKVTSVTNTGLPTTDKQVNFTPAISLRSDNYRGYSDFTGSVYGTVFYDSNDTAYYGDFNSTTRQYQAISFGDSSRYSAINTTINGSGAGDKLILYGGASNYDARLLVGADYDMLFKSQGNAAGRGSFKFYSGLNSSLALTIDGTQGLRAGTSYNNSPAGTYFSHTLSGVGTNRVVNFDGNGTTPSVWWTNGTRAYGAIDAKDPGLNFWANNGSGWQQQMEVNYGNVTINTDIRSPIFYDSNNTGYYVDPASTSSLNVLSMANKIIVGSFPNSTVNNGEAWIGRAADRSAGTMTVQLGGNLDRKFEVVDYGWTTVNFSVNGYGAAEASGSMRAPIFYDSNNTAYYVDAASNSVLNTLTVQGGTNNFNGITYFRTNNGGYCGSTDSAKLQAYSDSNNSAFLSFHKGGHYATNMGLDADNVIRIGGWSASANRLQLDMSGNLTLAGDVTAYSDSRVKENVVTVKNAIEKVNALRGVYYNRIDSEDKRTKLGVIAQEILEVVPEVVGQDNDGMYNVSYGNLAGLFIEAIKEQQTQIEQLKELVNQLINKQ